MWISRIRITGGFLSGLDLQLHPGLNVIIGPRGTGKTTLLELIRHAIGLSNVQPDRSIRTGDLVKNILGTGEVIVDLESDTSSQQLIVDAEGRGRRTEFASSALMIGQNELESIASDPESRLRLIDLRAEVSTKREPDPEIALLTRRLYTLREEMDSLVEQMRTRANLTRDREQLALHEAALMSRASTELAEVRNRLAEVERQQSHLHRDAEATSLLHSSIESGASDLASIRNLLSDPISLRIPDRLPKEIHVGLDRVRVLLAETGAVLDRLKTNLHAASSEIDVAEITLRAEATPLRTWLDESEKGLGEVTARLRNIDSQLSQLEIAGERLQTIRRRYANLLAERESYLDHFEMAQEERFKSRTRIASLVSERLNNRVIISIEHLTDSTEYRDLLVRLLQGSGIQFRGPAEAIARTTLPRQLVQTIESGQSGEIALLTGLPEQRIARALGHLDDPNSLSQIVATNVSDGADFLLRVGSELKSVEQLSTGQKCAVTLPILLTEHARTLVLDQPEDHLDNAYLVETVVRSISLRVAAGAQTIIATHNANIPVLGNADVVASLSSDGRRGFISQVGQVDEPAIVKDITNVMEGGLDAFRARAHFYNSHGR